MADNVAITAGSGTNIATDDVSSVHYQRMKIVDGTDGQSTEVPADSDSTAKRGLYVVPHLQSKAIIVATSSGQITTATTAYSAGDQVGPQFSFANAGRWTGGTGVITGVQLVDKSDIIGAYDFVFTRASVTLAGDNAAWAVSDADALNLIEVVQANGAIDVGNNRICRAMGLAIPFDTGSGTTLYGSLITRAAHTFFGAATDLQFTVYVTQD